MSYNKAKEEWKWKQWKEFLSLHRKNDKIYGRILWYDFSERRR